jgi:hypothetical protein
MNFKTSAGRLAPMSLLGLCFALSHASAESRVVRFEVDNSSMAETIAAVKSAMAKESCQIDAEKTYKGSGIQEIKCSIGDEKVTVQVSNEYFSGVSMQGQTLQKNFVEVWIKTSGGKQNWSKVMEQDMAGFLHKTN